MSFKRKNRTGRFFSSKYGIAVILAVSLFIVSPVVKIYIKSREATKMNEGVTQEISAMQARKEFLQAEVARLKTDMGKEEEAREKFNVGKPDEEMLIITDKGSVSGESSSTVQNIWQTIKSWF